MLSRCFRSLALSPESPPAGQAPPAIPPVNPEQRASALTTQLIAQHGTVDSALRHLVLQSITTDTELATLRSQVADYRAKLPDGSMVLPKAEAVNWQKLQDLKLTPDEIAAAVKERDTLKGTVSRTEAAKQLRAAAKAQGLDEDAFEDHGLRANLQVEMRDQQVTEHGKTVTKKLPFVRPAGDDKAPFKPLSEYTTALPAHDQRALQAAPGTTGTPYIEQRPTLITPSPGDPTADYLARQKRIAATKPNPLAPQQPAAAPAS